MKFIALFDIDHTLSNAYWRDGMIGAANWDEYHAESVKDKPLLDMIGLLQGMYYSGCWHIVAVTARPEKWRMITMRWLLEAQAPVHELLMREDNEYRPAPEMKLALVKARFGNDLRNTINCVFDDRADVVEAFKAEGVTALQVHGRVD